MSCNPPWGKKRGEQQSSSDRFPSKPTGEIRHILNQMEVIQTPLVDIGIQVHQALSLFHLAFIAISFPFGFPLEQTKKKVPTKKTRKNHKPAGLKLHCLWGIEALLLGGFQLLLQHQRLPIRLQVSSNMDPTLEVGTLPPKRGKRALLGDLVDFWLRKPKGKGRPIFEKHFCFVWVV